MQELIQLVEKLGSPRVLLAGDFILDSYVYGDVERINPEAPVPVLRTMRRQSSVGGAGNVAAAVPALGAQVRCVGVIGQDEAGGELSRLLNEAGAQTAPLLRVEGRPTAVKTRYVGLAQHRHPQQMLRVDEESTLPLSPAVQASIRGSFRTELSQADIVVLEDYNKGLLDDVLTPQLIADAARAGKIVVVDPALLNDFGRYRGAAVVKPNRYEAARASGIKIDSDASLAQAAAKLQKATDARATSTTSPAPATKRWPCWRWPWPAGAITNRPSNWPTWPAGWRSSASALPPSAGKNCWRRCAG
jgi:D-beta-D-heptose 7-phosphate kinase/D-beta-D-heptose 1-phosphate adenosyltransferase